MVFRKSVQNRDSEGYPPDTGHEGWHEPWTVARCAGCGYTGTVFA